MNERDVLLGVLEIVKRHVDLQPMYTADLEDRISKIPDAELPAARVAILNARKEIAASQDLRDSMIDLVQVNCDLAKIKGIEKGIYVGVVRDWVEQEPNWPALTKACEEAIAYIDANVKP